MGCLDPNICNYPNYPFYGIWPGWPGCYDWPKSSNCPPSPTPPWTRAQQSPLVQVIVQNDVVNIDMDTTFLQSTLATTSLSGSVASADGATATFTSSTPLSITSGQVVTISGAAHAFFNGVFTVTVTGTNTFTYTVTGGSIQSDPSATGTYGTMVFCSIPNGTYQRQMKQIFIPGNQITTTASFIISGTFAGGFTSLKFNGIGYSALLIWDGTAWQLISGNAQLQPDFR